MEKCFALFDGYCATAHDSPDWFEVDPRVRPEPYLD